MADRYPKTLLAARNANHELREKFFRLFIKHTIRWPEFAHIFREVSLGESDEALCVSATNNFFIPLEAFLKRVDKIDRELTEFQETREREKARKAYAEEVREKSEHVAEKILLAFGNRLDLIKKEIDNQEALVKSIEGAHRDSGELVRKAKTVHKNLSERSDILSQVLTRADNIHYAKRGEDPSCEELKKLISEIEDKLQDMLAVFEEFKNLESRYDGIISDLRVIKEWVQESDLNETGLRQHITAWEKLFADAEVDPYSALECDERDFSSKKSRLKECKDLMNASIEKLPPSKSMLRLQERAETMIEALKKKLEEKSPKAFIPKKLEPELVYSREEAVETPKPDAALPRRDTSSLSDIKLLGWQFAVVVFSVLCPQTGRGKGRTLKTAYKYILEPTGFTFGLGMEDFRECLQEAKEREYLLYARDKKWWLWKPSQKGYASAEKWITVLPEGFSEKVMAAKRNLDIARREMRKQYKKK